MRKRLAPAVIAVLLAGGGVDAQARGGHHHGHHDHGSYGFYLGAPLWWGTAYRPYPYPYDYGYNYGYGRPTVIVEREPTVYVQREPMAPVSESPPAPLWFYCTDPAGYFPYVKSCSQSWVSVDPGSVGSPPGQ